MKTATLTKLVLGLLVCSSFSLVGCGNNNAGSNNNRSVGTTVSQSINSPVTLTSSQDPTGLVQSMFSPVISSSQIGAISGSSGMQFGGQINMQPGGSNTAGSVRYMNSMNSYIGLQFKDSYALSGQAAPLVYTMGDSQTYGSSGTVAYYAQYATVNLQFADQYGNTIYIDGQFTMVTSGSQFSGTVSISTPSVSETTLGNFTLPTCSIFVCN